MFSVGRAVRSPRTRKSSAALHRTKKIGLYFRGVTALHSPGLVKLYDDFILLLLPQSVVSKLKLAEEKHGDSCGSRGLDETPQCVSTRRLISRPRNAQYTSVAIIYADS